LAVVAANWKMNLRRQSAAALASRLKDDGRECWLFPSFPLLPDVAQAIAGSRLRLGAQDVAPEPDGAFTGDVSAEQLADVGCSLVLIGHSERRHGHGERHPLLLRKLKRAIEGGLNPLYCVGETLAERQAGRAETVVSEQLGTLARLSEAERGLIAAVAYEPVWAIGTGENATPAQANEMHALLRGSLERMGLSVPLLYGGSVKADNARALLAQPQIDGVLVGGASLKYESLAAIDDAARES
jgi:triosephosphate isomerase (TIM)